MFRRLSNAALPVISTEMAGKPTEKCLRVPGVSPIFQPCCSVNWDGLSEYEEHPLRRGCPLKVVPAGIARMMLADLNAGRSKRYVWRKYSKSHPFSRPWLDDVIADGRLELMAREEMEPA